MTQRPRDSSQVRLGLRGKPRLPIILAWTNSPFDPTLMIRA
jgi:hypothetical protein